VSEYEVMRRVLQHPWGLALTLATVQVTLLAMAVLAAVVTRRSWRRALSWKRGRWSLGPALLVALATPAVNLLTIIIVRPVQPTGEHLEMLSAVFRFHLVEGRAAWLVFFTCLLPAFCEETLFRGYLQQAFLRRYRPVVAISLAALLFALLHMDPTHVIATFPLGLWLGTVAYLARSLWPVVIGHAINNLASVASVASPGTDPLDLPQPWLLVLILAGGLLGAATFAVLIRRGRTAPTAGSAEL
jgi:uncharacterized protein